MRKEKKMKKRVLAMLLVVILCISAVPSSVTARAQGTGTQADVTESVSDRSAELSEEEAGWQFSEESQEPAAEQPEEETEGQAEEQEPLEDAEESEPQAPEQSEEQPAQEPEKQTDGETQEQPEESEAGTAGQGQETAAAEDPAGRDYAAAVQEIYGHLGAVTTTQQAAALWDALMDIWEEIYADQDAGTLSLDEDAMQAVDERTDEILVYLTGSVGYDPYGLTPANEEDASRYNADAGVFWDTTADGRGLNSTKGVSSVTIRQTSPYSEYAYPITQINSEYSYNWGSKNPYTLGRIFPDAVAGASKGDNSTMTDGVITIVPEKGYRIAEVIIACASTISGNGHSPFSCTAWKSGNAKDELEYGVGTVEVPVSTLDFSHDDAVSTNYYFILIRVEVIANPLYVEYDYGAMDQYLQDAGNKIEDTVFNSPARWTEASAENVYGTGYEITDMDGAPGVKTANTQFKYSYGADLTNDQKIQEIGKWTHKANTVTDSAKEEAATLAGYKFAGWSAQYYINAVHVAAPDYTGHDFDGDDSFYENGENYIYFFDRQNTYASGSFEEGASLPLETNGELSAEWMPYGMTLRKTVTGLPDGDNTPRTYSMTVYYRADENSAWRVYGEKDLPVRGSGSAEAVVYPSIAGLYYVLENSDHDTVMSGGTDYHASTAGTGEDGRITVNAASYGNAREEEVSGTTVAVLDNVSLAVTNAYTHEEVRITIEKAWEDGDDQDGIRPESVTVDILADGVPVRTAELGSRGNWTAVVNGLPRLDSQNRVITYTLQEEAFYYWW